MAQPETSAELQIEAEIERDRARLRHLVDRIDALRSLWIVAGRYSNRADRPLTLDELFDAPEDEIERAELQVLADRISGGAHTKGQQT